MAWLRPEHGRRRMLSELLLCWTLVSGVAGGQQSKHSNHLSSVHNTTILWRDGDMPRICTIVIYNSTQLLMIPDANENGIFTLNNYCNMLLCWCGQFQHLSWIHDVLERSPQPHRQQHCSLTVVKVKWATEDREHCIITTLLQKLMYKMLNNDQESTFNIVCVDIKNISSMFSVRKLH